MRELKNKEKVKIFCLICFLVLMENDEGIFKKHYDYVLEKYDRIYNAYLMYNSLHMSLRHLVISYGRSWGIDLEKLIVQMEVDCIVLSRTEFDKKYTWED